LEDRELVLSEKGMGEKVSGGLTLVDVSDLDRKIAALKQRQAKLQAERDERLSLTTVACEKCGLEFWIRDLTFTSVDRCYPYGYEPEWYFSHAEWSCKCGRLNRIEKDSPLLELRRVFKEYKEREIR
jgi:uncharacterized small protein (DUF1192 family)